MATGYTYKIHDGKNQSFEDFVLTCARAFGACIGQRDNPMDEPPQLVKPSTYHSKALDEAKKDLELFNSTPPEIHKANFEKHLKDSHQYNKKSIQDNLSLKLRYQDMLDKVKKWTCPTEDHNGLKKFMIEQLGTSIDHDCNYDYYERAEKDLQKLTYESWLKSKLDMIKNNIKYHTESHNKELENCENKNKWIISLYESLGLKIK